MRTMVIRPQLIEEMFFLKEALTFVSVQVYSEQSLLHSLLIGQTNLQGIN